MFASACPCAPVDFIVLAKTIVEDKAAMVAHLRQIAEKVAREHHLIQGNYCILNSTSGRYGFHEHLYLQLIGGQDESFIRPSISVDEIAEETTHLNDEESKGA